MPPSEAPTPWWPCATTQTKSCRASRKCWRTGPQSKCRRTCCSAAESQVQASRGEQDSLLHRRFIRRVERQNLPGLRWPRAVEEYLDGAEDGFGSFQPGSVSGVLDGHEPRIGQQQCPFPSAAVGRAAVFPAVDGQDGYLHLGKILFREVERLNRGENVLAPELHGVPLVGKIAAPPIDFGGVGGIGDVNHAQQRPELLAEGHGIQGLPLFLEFGELGKYLAQGAVGAGQMRGILPV